MTAPASIPSLPSERSEHHKAHGPNWTKWLGHLRDRPGVSGLEIGVWQGEGAEWFLEHVLTHPSSSYVGVDTFKGSEEHALGGIDCTDNERITRERLERFGDRATLIKGTSSVAMLGLLAKGNYSFDFVYVDAAHDAMSVLRDAVLGFELLRPGGVILFDDYEWTVMADEVDRPKMAIDAFLACYARRIEVLGLGWQVACRKTS